MLARSLLYFVQDHVFHWYSEQDLQTWIVCSSDQPMVENNCLIAQIVSGSLAMLHKMIDSSYSLCLLAFYNQSNYIASSWISMKSKPSYNPEANPRFFCAVIEQVVWQVGQFAFNAWLARLGGYFINFLLLNASCFQQRFNRLPVKPCSQDNLALYFSVSSLYRYHCPSATFCQTHKIDE